MFIAKVIGNLWATRKHRCLNTYKLLIIQPVDGISGRPTDKPLLAVDKHIDAGIGDMVLVMDEGNSARQILEDRRAAIRTIVVGVIDEVTEGKESVRYH